jgi:type IV secretion system protein VirB11
MSTNEAVALLEHVMQDLAPFQADQAVEEICVRPGVAHVWRHGRFERHAVALSADDIEDIATLAAAYWHQDVGPTQPLLSTDMPTGERLQVVLPPCVRRGKPSLTMRKSTAAEHDLDSLDRSGMFTNTATGATGMTEADRELLALYRAREWKAFYRGAVRTKKTIVACGETASGKTHFIRALMREIPLHERLITVQDSDELGELPHDNLVSLFYSAGNQGTANVSAGRLIEAALRMRIGRLMLQELRKGDGAATAFLRSLETGHTGALTTVHARNPRDAFATIAGMVREDPSAGSQAEVERDLRSYIDVVVHCARDPFRITEVWFRPAAEEAIAVAAGENALPDAA